MMDNKMYIRMDRDWKSREEYEKKKKQERVNKLSKIKKENG
jgi:predicted secreted protein